MTQSPANADRQSGLARREDIEDVLGDLDDGVIMAILALEPMIVDVEEASM